MIYSYKEGVKFYTDITFYDRKYRYAFDIGSTISTIPLNILSRLYNISEENILTYLEDSGFELAKGKDIGQSKIKCYKAKIENVNIGGDYYEEFYVAVVPSNVKCVLGQDFMLAHKTYMDYNYINVFDFNKELYHSEDAKQFKTIRL